MLSTSILLLFLSYSLVICVLQNRKAIPLNSHYSELHGRTNREAFLFSIRSGARSRYGYSDDDVQDEELIEIDDEDNISDNKTLPTAETVGVQFMITNKMRRVLESQLGYLPDEVDEMDPQIAAVVIDRVLSRPSKGMPDSWKRNASLEESSEDNRSYRSNDQSDENSSRVAKHRTSLLSSIRNQLTDFKDATLRFGSNRILPIIPTLCFGLCVYGTVLAAPSAFRLLTNAASTLSQRLAFSWIESDDSNEEKPIPPIKPTIIKSPDSKNKKVTQSTISPIKNGSNKEVKNSNIQPGNRVTVDNSKITKERAQSKTMKRVDLEGLASAQHLSIWEVIRFRSEMIRRSFY